MPLDNATRQHVIEYVTRDIVPKTVTPRPHQAMTWFKAQFAFVGDAKLQEHLGEAFYQARYIGRVREALALKAGFNHAFCKYQILLYASIYECVIDYLLDAVSDDPVVTTLLTRTDLQKISAISSKAQLTFTDGSETHDLLTCRQVSRTQQLRDVRFDDRVAAAETLGIVRNQDSAFIKSLYKSRNNIHLQSSATKDFKPDDQQSSEAFRLLFAFTENAAAWCKKRKL